MKYYIASPLFTEYERNRIATLAELLRRNGHEVYVPMEHQSPGAWDMSNEEWGKRVFAEDVKALDACDHVYVLYYGLYSDSGTAWEQGYAYAKGKKITVFNEGNSKEVSLMVVNGQTAPIDGQFNNSYQT